MKGVFEVSGVSRYNDEITRHYHFEDIAGYKSVADRCVGDWIIYRTTRASGKMAYIAVAHVDRVDPDLERPNHYYARVSQYLPFDRPVSHYDSSGRYEERFLRELPNRRDVGRTLQRKSMRELEPSDFAAIVYQGLSDTLDPSNRIRLELDTVHIDYATQTLLNEAPTVRRIESMLINRKIRDASFRGRVLDAYDNTCAVTGLRIINGGGKAEAQAAHIWPVADGGPDTVQNGIALSATAHWLFDRHLISLKDDFRLLVSDNKVPSELRQLFPPNGERIRLPANPDQHPDLRYCARHLAMFGGHNG
jgi:putative restriction endonuclease